MSANMLLYVMLGLTLLAALAVMLCPLLPRVLRPASNMPIETGNERHFVIAVMLFFFVGAFGFYYCIGSPEIVPMMEHRDAKLAELKVDIVRNSNLAKSNPKDMAAWVSLGKDFMETNQFHAAANAFKQAVVLSKGNPLIILAYASALIYEADGKITDDARKSLLMVLLQQPQNPEARYLLAVRSLQDGHQEEAMKEMKELYRSLPPDSPIKDMIDRQIGKK